MASIAAFVSFQTSGTAACGNFNRVFDCASVRFSGGFLARLRNRFQPMPNLQPKNLALPVGGRHLRRQFPNSRNLYWRRHVFIRVETSAKILCLVIRCPPKEPVTPPFEKSAAKSSRSGLARNHASQKRGDNKQRSAAKKSLSI